MSIFYPTKENVKYLGRAYMNDNLLILGFSASGIAFRTGKGKVSINVVGDSTSDDISKVTERARVAVYLNGDIYLDTMISEKNVTFNIDADKDDNEIIVLKKSENAMSAVGIEAINSDTYVKPSADKDLYIEFIGDSITCGYGVDDEDPLHTFRTETEDCTRAYAIETAKLLDADASLVSLSGYGIISGYSDDGETRHPEQLIPSFYEKCGYCAANLNGHQPQDKAWDFSGRQPQLIVINLGTNDDSYCKEYEERREYFVQEYVEFLKMVRKHHSESVILCVLGIMGENLCPYVERAVELYKNISGDLNVYTEMFKEQLAEDGRVSDYHPTNVSHKKAAKQVSERIKQLLGL